MKQSKTNTYRKVFTVYFTAVIILIILGLVMALKSPGELFSKASLAIENTSFEKSSFPGAMIKSLKNHAVYCAVVLLFAGNIAGIIVNGTYIGFKAFSLGTVVGLAVKCCVFKKAITICFCAFVSNVLVFPLYAVLFAMNLKYSIGTCTGNLCFRKVLNEYFSYAARVFVVFTLICAADCIQNALGIFVVNLLG